MKKQLSQVKKFQKSFAQEVHDKPTLVNIDLAKLRFELMKEENLEYLEAVEKNDLIGVTDAVADMAYILFGTALTHGLENILEKCFDEVHRSNMSKLDVNGKPIINGENGVFDSTRPLGKILKSKDYSEPDIKRFIS